MCCVPAGRELAIWQIAQEAVNGLVRESLHDGEAVASQELMGHLLRTQRFLGIFILAHCGEKSPGQGKKWPSRTPHQQR
jgi:hypothetical protein